VKTLVPQGVLQKPSGLALVDDTLYVTDNATSRIHRFDITGKLLQAFDTGLPAGCLAGIAMGPDATLYITNLLTGGVHRVELTAP
jgi:sugar lactone lactonase YvrE